MLLAYYQSYNFIPILKSYRFFWHFLSIFIDIMSDQGPPQQYQGYPMPQPHPPPAGFAQPPPQGGYMPQTAQPMPAQAGE